MKIIKGHAPKFPIVSPSLDRGPIRAGRDQLLNGSAKGSGALQENADPQTAVDITAVFEADHASMQLDNLTGDREAEAGTGSGCFGGIEGIESRLQVGFRHTGAGIFDV